MMRTYATSNDQGKPQLLQVLGDTTLGVKGFTPPKLGRIFTFGGEIPAPSCSTARAAWASPAAAPAPCSAASPAPTAIRN